MGLEVFRAVRYSTHYELFGGSSTYDHGRFVYKNHLDGLPFITDNSDADEIIQFDEAIREYGFDCIYPTMDGVITVFSKYRQMLTPGCARAAYARRRRSALRDHAHNSFKAIKLRAVW